MKFFLNDLHGDPKLQYYHQTLQNRATAFTTRNESMSDENLSANDPSHHHRRCPSR